MYKKTITALTSPVCVRRKDFGAVWTGIGFIALVRRNVHPQPELTLIIKYYMSHFQLINFCYSLVI